MKSSVSDIQPPKLTLHCLPFQDIMVNVLMYVVLVPAKSY